MLDLHERISQVVMQPTTLCNLNCGYCYLPDRLHRRAMQPSVASAVAASLPLDDQCLPVSWHAGEPLAVGVESFALLLEPFHALQAAGRIQHVVQTNATLIDDQWVDLLERHGFVVGVSIDGNATLNRNRVDRAGREAFSRAMRGIALLRRRKIPFHAIAVVTPDSLHHAHGLFRFFADLGCASLGINIEEQVGTHVGGISDASAVREFWETLFDAWRSNPALEVREIRGLLSWMLTVADERPTPAASVDLLPSIAHNGDVVLLSPEFVGLTPSTYSTFVVGNVLQEDLTTILRRASRIRYVSDFANGVARCYATCEYFASCGGRSAANKYFETGSTDANVTRYCLNSTQLPAQAILHSLT